MTNGRSGFKVGVYVDEANIYRSGGPKMRYDVLRKFACRDNAELIRLNAYVTYDKDRAGQDKNYRLMKNNFYSALRDMGYKVIIKTVTWYVDENGTRYGKANADLDLAVDALLQSENLDRVLIATGDGDFVQVVKALQNRGCRVEIVAFDNVSGKLREEADMFLSGYLIPDLLPPAHNYEKDVKWGEMGSRVRGCCYWRHQDKNYGFFRFLRGIGSHLWLTDLKHPDTPYGTAFFHDTDLPSNAEPWTLPSRNLMFEFTLVESDRGNKVQAADVELVSRL